MSTRQRREAEQRRRRRIRWAIVAAVVALVALGGVLFLPISNDEGPAPVAISMVEYAFAPVEATAEPGQELAITNDGAINHNYLVPDLGKGIELAAGDKGSLRLPDDVKAGTYRVICDLPGHVEKGMVGSLVVK
jgi:plastocyanin